MLSSLDRWVAPAPGAVRVGWLHGRVYAHRGLHGRGLVENSPSAFAAAIARGIGIECDVQASADGRAVVFHDALLDRLTGESGPVAERPAAGLNRIVLSGSSDRIPILRDVIEQVAARVPLLIEVKTRGGHAVAPLCRAVWRDLEGYSGAYAVMSFDPRVPNWFAIHAPNTVRGLVVTETDARTPGGMLGRHRALWRARPDFLACDVRDLPSRFAAGQRERGLPLLAWTVSTREQLRRAQHGADAWIAEAEGLAAACASD